MNITNKLLCGGIIFGLGMGTGLRANRKSCEPLTTEHVQSPAIQVDLPVSVHTEDKEVSTPTSNSDMFRALCLWEHRGKIRPDDVSEAGAVGPAQITPIFLEDMNIYLGTNYTLKDCKNYEVAYFLTRKYWEKYSLTTDEERSRCHLAGPRAMTRKKTWEETSDYWEGVQSYIGK